VGTAARRSALRIIGLVVACCALLFVAAMFLGSAVAWIDDDYCLWIARDLMVTELVGQRPSLWPLGMVCTYETADGMVTRGPQLVHTWYALALIPCGVALVAVLRRLRHERAGRSSHHDRDTTLQA